MKNSKKASASAKTEDKEAASIYREYFDATDKYCQEYGRDAMVLMQVGSFFEAYGLKDYQGSQGKPGFYSNIDEFCRVCDVKLVEKKNTYMGLPVYMAGIGEYTLDKYINLLMKAQKTVVVFVQQDDMTKTKGKKRVFYNVFSPGTFLPLEDEGVNDVLSGRVSSNHIMTIWIKQFKSLQDGMKYLCSFSCVNILSGNSYIYEYSCPRVLSPTSFDDLERAVSSFSPNEVIFIKENPEDEEAARILQYVGLGSNTVVHRVDDATHEKIQRLQRDVYVRETLAFFFGGANRVKSITEFALYEFATQNLCFLLDWVQGHNPNLVKYISTPIFSNSSFRVVLANHTLKQLNVIGPGGGRLSSVSAFLNRTCCSLGNRLFQYQIQNPTFDEEWLQHEYSLTEWLIGAVSDTTRQDIRGRLSAIKDLEKIGRQLLVGKVWPSAMYQLYYGIQQYNSSMEPLLNMAKSLPNHTLLNTAKLPSHLQENQRFFHFMESKIRLDLCQDIKTLQSNTAFFQKGVCAELDKLTFQIEQARKTLQAICDALNETLSENRGNGEEVDHVKIHETPKSGCCLQITQTRGSVLKQVLKTEGRLDLDGGIKIPFKEIRVVGGRGDKDTVEFPLLIQTCNNLLLWEDQIGKRVEDLFRAFLDEIKTNWMGFLQERFRQIALLDVAFTKATIALDYNYCRPELVPWEEEGTSFFEARDLRHVLIEHLQKTELYVANDISLGVETQQGILLYGTNAVGKTSLIKSAGIAVIMAQAGMHVPCSHFRYRPYTALYSRILGNDDLFRGLSTFVVEMSELRVILKMADERSLVLGDELCSGTETESALSIFTAGLQHLYRNRVGFLFATHFHEIVSFEEIEQMGDRIRLKHLSVLYDRERGELVYNRKLQEGSGNGTYGLEVASSLSMPTEFIEQAYQIRQKYFDKVGVTPLSFKQSRYTSDKIRGMCEICSKRLGDEVHHIQPQHQADERGFIGHHHKNHPANLLNVCFQCHDRLHASSSTHLPPVKTV